MGLSNLPPGCTDADIERNANPCDGVHEPVWFEPNNCPEDGGMGMPEPGFFVCGKCGEECAPPAPAGMNIVKLDDGSEEIVSDEELEAAAEIYDRLQRRK